VRRRFSTLRFVALLALGALAVHDLRYRVGYHEHAGAALREQGHAYLTVVGILVAGLVAIALGLFGATLLRARRGRASGSGGAPFGITWSYATFSLATIYLTQEWLEGQLSHGHPGGLQGIVGNAGWVAFLLALAIGAAIALLLGGAEAVIALVARRARRAQRTAPGPVLRLPRFTPLPLDGVARHLAGRGPPLHS
jgi:hypothetical protein